MQHLTAPQLAEWINDESRDKPVLLDVREPWEFQTCHIDGAVLMPMQTVPQVTNLTGGVHAWAQQVDPSMPTY
jgi:rhodanese-related sulfurtransferase